MDNRQVVSPAQAAGRTNLALIYQEILTAITRFRSNRQAVADAASFRNQIKAAIGVAEAEATRRGYAADDVRLATFAVVAFLDESILNSNNPIFADWPRMPLQEELFGVHTAGRDVLPVHRPADGEERFPANGRCAGDLCPLHAARLPGPLQHERSGERACHRVHGVGKAATSSGRTAPAGSELGAAPRCGPAESLRSLGYELFYLARWERCFLPFCFLWGSNSCLFPGHQDCTRSPRLHPIREFP